MNACIRPGRACGAAALPPSKSCANRLLICAALSRAESRIDNVSPSGDILAMLDCIAALGRKFTLTGNGVYFPPQSGLVPTGEYPCRDSATALRMLIPAALAVSDSAVFTGSKRLMERGISVYEEIFPGKRIKIHRSAQAAELEGRLTPGHYSLRGDVSSQFVSGLLLALPLLEEESVIELIPPTESAAYIEMTAQTARSFGIVLEKRGENAFFIPGGQSYRGGCFTVEGDMSNAAYMKLLTLIGGRVEIIGAPERTCQPDVAIDELAAALRAGDSVNVSACPDLAPPLMAYCAFLGRGELTGTRRLLLKESSRAEAMAQELAKLGVKAEVGENSFRISSGRLRQPTEPLSGHNDHRIVMALASIMTVTGGTLTGAEAVSKSWPEFFDVLGSLGINTER